MVIICSFSEYSLSNCYILHYWDTVKSSRSRSPAVTVFPIQWQWRHRELGQEAQGETKYQAHKHDTVMFELSRIIGPWVAVLSTEVQEGYSGQEAGDWLGHAEYLKILGFIFCLPRSPLEDLKQLRTGSQKVSTQHIIWYLQN